MRLTFERSSRFLTLILVALFIVLSVPFREAPHAQGTSVPVTVRITRVIETACDEGFGESCPNDYFSKVNIDGQGLTESPCCAHPGGEPPEFSPNDWVFSRSVPIDRNPVAIHVQLWDQDDGSFDDPVDIANGGDYLDLTFDLNTCTFQGSDLTARQGAGIPNLLQGQSEGADDDSARIYFTITTPVCITRSNTVDTDGDGLFNGWELPFVGIDGNGDGAPDLFLNSDPTHKDLFVEVDWMECSSSLPAGGCPIADHSHAPAGDVLNDVINAFKNAPVANPDGGTGITLHLMQDEAVGDRVGILFKSDGPGPVDDFNDIKRGNPSGPCTGSFGTAAQRSSASCAQILQAKRLAFRYMIFAHSFAETPGSSGSAEVGFTEALGRFGGNDFIVTLGDWETTDLDSNGGRRVAEASTFMHEFGHTLSLLHGGGENVNCKPNYLSVMSYTLQFPKKTTDPNRPMDYSRAALGPLNENGGLNENAGLGGPAGRLTIYGLNGNLSRAQADAATINWNGINGLEANATADVNFIAVFRPASDQGGCSTASPNQILQGFDDWQNLAYNFRNSPFFADGVTASDLGLDLQLQELTAETLRLVNDPPPDLKVAKVVDKATAAGGDTLNYTVTVTNVEGPTALNVSLVDRLPNDSEHIRALPNLDQGASNTQTFTFLVPCSAADGGVLTNRASVTGTNALGYADVNLSNNFASAATTVQAPKLTLSKTATASVNAGEAISYTITYQNTGAGGAANIVITDTLPAGLYYSTALDTGAGPRPNTVTVNSDGTRTLTWQPGTLAGKSGLQTIQYTARPSLLMLGGETLSNSAGLTFTNVHSCTYAPVTASASTVITVAPASKDALSMGFWRNHSQLWTAEIRARIQATDTRYDTNADGMLSAAEVAAMLASAANQPKILAMQLLATYLNLATRRVNAATLIESKATNALDLDNVAEAAIFGIGTLALPLNAPNRTRYEDATRVLDEINANKSEIY